ncbi:CHAT domain-containing protein [Roseimarinus sediminis]|uniref:CHAT domain-containing protein n=1 Tax=Roseimarinus sediminis TaxID=1610899 RepID=UPI003D250BD4
MKSKTISISQIQYILISKEHSLTDTDFNIKALRLLREMPKDLLQLDSSINHFDFLYRFNIRNTVNLFSIPDNFFTPDKIHSADEFKSYSNEFNNSIIYVFIIDSNINSHSTISKIVDDLPYAYFTIINETKDFTKYNSQKQFNNSTEFIELLKKDLPALNDLISKQYNTPRINNFKINENRTFYNDNPVYGSNLAENNFYILNQVIGNYWLEYGKKGTNKTKITLPSERINEIISQAQKIDSLTHIMINEVGIKPIHGFDPILPTLIIISPYNFPKIKRVLKKPSKIEKAFLKVFQSEQDLNYQIKIDSNITEQLSPDGIKMILSQISNKLNFLDCAGYLHALFNYSPVIRLPNIGKSINLDLSHFEVGFSDKKNAISKINKFGKKLNELVFTDKTQDYITNRNGQIAVISDLPFEWIILNELPLCFTHDICRIPEYNQNAIINNAIHNQRFNFTIGDDIIERTLIIHCASKSDIKMHQMFDFIDSYKDKLHFHSEKCYTIDEINIAIKKYSPEFLIFDCHGDFDKESLSSYLIIDHDNNVYLTGDDIVKNGIHAPLVMLSACNTMPNYGYVKFLSDAFMEAGAFTVTTTFLPILIKDAATLIIRILNKLSQQRGKMYHSNWLNFMSHVLRTMLIHESILKAQSKGLLKEIDVSTISEILTETMIFSKRTGSYKRLENLLRTNSTQKEFKFNELNNEWLSYSIIGRADLLYFENWINEYIKINTTTTPNIL